MDFKPTLERLEVRDCPSAAVQTAPVTPSAAAAGIDLFAKLVTVGMDLPRPVPPPYRPDVVVPPSAVAAARPFALDDAQQAAFDKAVFAVAERDHPEWSGVISDARWWVAHPEVVAYYLGGLR